ncbi:MAG: GYD domain-containing protein [Thaumarchaeota archaeon]|nr:GYD domain-containing protein [Nitrososphaerota archaeon]
MADSSKNAELKRNIKESTKRRTGEKALVEKAGVKIHGIYHTWGPYDSAWILEAPSDEILQTLLLIVGKVRGVKTTTLGAFTEAEVDKTLERVPQTGNASPWHHP